MFTPLGTCVSLMRGPCVSCCFTSLEGTSSPGERSTIQPRQQAPQLKQSKAGSANVKVQPGGSGDVDGLRASVSEQVDLGQPIEQNDEEVPG